MAAAVPAGVVAAITNPEELPKLIAKDFSRRYGDLARGDNKAFRERIKKEGAAAELVDISAFVAPQSAALGRGLGQAARTAPKNSRLRRIATEPRPKLRTAGNVSRVQELSPNLGRALAQRGEDALRARRQRKRNERGDRQQKGRPALQPREGEVVPVFSGRAQRIEAASTQSKRYNRMRRQQGEEVDRGLKRSLSKLNPKERQAAWFVLHGIVTPDDPVRAVKQLEARKARVVENRQRAGLTGRSRELEVIDELLGQPEKAFTVRLREFGELESPRTRRVAETDPELKPTTAETRRQRPVARELGIERQYDRLVGEFDSGARRARATEAKTRARRADVRVRRAERRLQTARRREAVVRRGAEIRVGQKDAQILKADKGMRAVAHARSAAERELRDARAAFGNAARNSKRYTTEELTAALQRRRRAERNVAQVRKAYKRERERVLADAPANRNPRGALKTLEDRRGRLVEAEQAYARAVREREAAKAQAKQARKAASKGARRELDDQRDTLDAEFAATVRERARQERLPEPGYVEHVPQYRTGTPNRAAMAIGGAKAAPGLKESKMSLYDLGEADVSPEQVVNSLARTIKRRENWGLVADQIDRHSLPLPARDVAEVLNKQGQLQRLGEQRFLDNLTLHELRTYFDRKGVDLGDLQFWNPGIVRRQRADTGHRDVTDEAVEGEIARALDGATSFGGLVDEVVPREMMRSRGWRVLTREAHEELNASAAPSGAPGRVVEKVMGTQSRLMLGYNPTWPIAQIAANIFQSMFAIQGNVADYFRAQRWYKSLPEPIRKALDDEWGTGIGTAHGRKTKVGAAANSDWVNRLRAWRETVTFRANMLKQKTPARNIPGNFADALFAFDDAQNRFFRKTVLYNSVKRQAYRDMRKEAGVAYELEQRIGNILKLGPEDRMRAIVQNQDLIEKHARHVDDFLGNWTRFTNRERRYLKRGLLFYGFLRFAVRTTFYTVPVKHPVMGSIVAKLAQLHTEEVKELLGGDEAPWAYSRLFFGEGDDMKSIDLLRINPVSSPITDVVAEGPRALGGLSSPVVQATLDQIATKKTGIGQPFRVDGKAAEAEDDRFYPRVWADSVLGAAFPYRAGEKVTQKGTQGDDSMLFSPRPIKYKSGEAIGREMRKRSQEGSPGREALELLLPFFVPKPDYTRDTVARKQREDQPSSGRRRSSGGGDPLLKELDDLRRGRGGAVDPLHEELEELRRGVR